MAHAGLSVSRSGRFLVIEGARFQVKLNCLRGLLYEFGIVLPKGPAAALEQLAAQRERLEQARRDQAEWVVLFEDVTAKALSALADDRRLAEAMAKRAREDFLLARTVKGSADLQAKLGIDAAELPDGLRIIGGQPRQQEPLHPILIEPVGNRAL